MNHSCNSFTRRTNLEKSVAERYPKSYSLGYALGQISWQAFLLLVAATIFSLLWSRVSGPIFMVPEPWSNPGWLNTVCVFLLAGVSKKLYKLLRYGV